MRRHTPAQERQPPLPPEAEGRDAQEPSRGPSPALTPSGPARPDSLPAAPAPAAPAPADGTRLTRRAVRARRRRTATYLKWAALAVAAVAIAVAVVLAWRPQPIPADLAAVDRGPLRITVDEDGRTRVRDRFVISAPLAGTLARIELHPGDSVTRGTVVAWLVPVATPLLDPRARAEAEARVAAAADAVRQAATAVDRARAASAQALREAERARTLQRAGAESPQAAEQAELTARTLREDLASAEYAQRIAEAELRVAQAALTRLESGGGGGRSDRFEIRAPVDGRVLKVLQESEGVVSPGTPLLELGDPRALEVVVDVLSADAVNIRRGARVLIERWGGDTALAAHVRRVEPSAFTRISALGVEEQRVNVIIDPDGPRGAWAALGDGYRVDARIVVWEAPDALRAPAGAVFRDRNGWAVYRVRNGRAHLTAVELGRRNAAQAEVVGGLSRGDTVVVYPGDNVVDGARIESR